MRLRELPRAEWGKVQESAGPLLACVNPETTAVMVVEDGEKIAGSLVVFRASHIEALEIDPDYRGNPSVGRMLIRGAVESAQQWPDTWAISGTDSDHMRDIICRLGGVKIPVDHYLLSLGETA